MSHVLLLAAALLARAADTEPKGPELKVREVALGKAALLEAKFGNEPTPVKIASGDELKKKVSAGAAQDELKKHVNFTKEYLLVVTWGGSGGDKLAHTVEKGKRGPVAVFKRMHGETDDFRRHQKAYVLPKAMAYRFEK